jgi:hypothetical protein
MSCNAMYPMQYYFWKVFHMHDKLICHLYALLCWQKIILVKSGCYTLWTRGFLDPVPGGGGDAQVFQQSPKPTGGDRSFNPEVLHLICILEHLIVLRVAWGRLLFIGLVFYIMVLRLLLFLSRQAPEPLGSQGPPALSHKVPPPVMRAEAIRM